MATTTHIQKGGALRRTGTIVVLVLSICAGALIGKTALPSEPSAAASAPQAAAGRPYSYGWPIKPFDRQHPVRGYFADPRSVFHGAPTIRGLMTSSCACSYHQGIDISAPDGTAVYAVRSGTVRIVTRDWIEVDSGGGVAFQYWHIGALVSTGDQVTAEQTVLGRILRASHHVHLTQLQDGNPVNPMAAGNIGPYADTTVPRVNRITFRAGNTGPELLPEYLHGRVQIVADAADVPAIPVPGMWGNLPVSPARLTYRIESVPQRRVVVPTTTALDVTRGLPGPDMWRTYARGTHMNMVQMATHRYWYQPGVYLFKLVPRGFDTRRLRDGVYVLTVTAADAAGNQSSATQIINVHNRAGWLR
jgi:murein DD-endopeptidase MepM/ murein hydrolase activator NlpD